VALPPLAPRFDDGNVVLWQRTKITSDMHAFLWEKVRYAKFCLLVFRGGLWEGLLPAIPLSIQVFVDLRWIEAVALMQLRCYLMLWGAVQVLLVCVQGSW